MAPMTAGKTTATVLVDNRSLVEEALPAYGLSMHLEVHAGRRTHRILFDVGPSIEALMHNASILGIDLGDIDRVVISHFHKDHYGALEGLLEAHGAVGLVIYVPEEPWFARHVLERVRRLGGRVVHASMFTQVAPGVYAIGPVTNTREISLEILFPGGRGALLVGCGHGGLKTISRWARYIREYMLIAGGFHLKEEPPEEAASLASWMSRELRPRLVVPLHCSNHDDVFSSILGPRYVRGGIGLVIEISSSMISSRIKTAKTRIPVPGDS